MAAYGAEYIRNARRHLNVFESNPLDIGFQPQGHLLLSDLQGSQQLGKNIAHSISNGQSLTLLDKIQLKKQFDWLFCQDDIALGAFGLENEGWFDPFALIGAMRNKSVSLGANYLSGELLDFNLHYEAQTDPFRPPRQCANYAVIRTPKGGIRQIQFARLVIAAGPENAEVAAMLRLGQADGLRSMPVPLKKRKRYYYAFESANGPGLDFPLLIDPSGVFVRRDGFGGQYITGKCPTEEEQIDNNNSDVDYRYFENRIAPILKHRIPSFSDLKLLRGWAAFEDVNTWDQQPIIGRHPYYSNVFFAAGLGVHSVQMAPAVGRALQELILLTDYKTIDLHRFGWDRLFSGQQLEDKDFAER
jgi:FAD-dependent oxidoreductase domain-containing protein 1